MRLLIFALIVMMAMTQQTNTNQTPPKFIKFEYHNGDEILRALKKYDDNIYIVFFFSDPGYNRDLRTTNDYFRDKLRTDILEKDHTGTYYYAEVDVTDTKSNGNLVSKVKADSKELKENPTASILVMKKGKGKLIYGPTAINSVQTALNTLNPPAQQSSGNSR